MKKLIEKIYGNIINEEKQIDNGNNEHVNSALSCLVKLSELYAKNFLTTDPTFNQQTYDELKDRLKELKDAGLKESKNCKELEEKLECWGVEVDKLSRIKRVKEHMLSSNHLFILDHNIFKEYLESRTRKGLDLKLMTLNSFTGKISDNDLKIILRISKDLRENIENNSFLRYNEGLLSIDCMYKISPTSEEKRWSSKLNNQNIFMFWRDSLCKRYATERMPLLEFPNLGDRSVSGTKLEKSDLLLALDSYNVGYVFSIAKEIIFIWHVLGNTVSPKKSMITYDFK